jgi:hypothetical protein
MKNYRLRKSLWLKISSQTREKANDPMAARRQKRNGASWSPDGSLAMAALEAAECNGSLESWIAGRKAEIKLRREPGETAA